jgi:hypothetical protein
MKISEIRNLTYAKFYKTLKTIENRLNYNFKNREISYDQFYWELNFILYGLDIHSDDYLELLMEQGNYIFSEFQNFYFKVNRPCFVIIIDGIKKNETISNITIRLLK